MKFVRNIYASDRLTAAGTAVLAVVFLLWQLPGIFPLMSYEGDALSVCAGCEYTYTNGIATLGDKGYGYWMQPLTYLLIVSVKHLLPTLSCETIYSALSSVAALLFQLFSVMFAWRMSDRKDLIYMLPAMLLIPESYALAMYPNSTSLSACVFTGALCLLQRSSLTAGFGLLVVAPLFRLDVLMIYPVIPMILAFNGHSWRKSVVMSAMLACAVVAVVVAVYAFLGADPAHTLSEYSRWSDIIMLRKNLIAVYGFYGPVSLILVPAGIVLCLRERRRGAAVVAIAAMLIIHVVEFRFGNASKHFALLLPFVLPMVSTAIGRVMALKSRRIRWLISGVIAIAMTSGVRVLSSDGQFSQSRLNDYAPTLVAVDCSRAEVGFVIGAGQPMMTADEAVLTSGSLFYPMFIHNIKETDRARVKAVEEFAVRDDSVVLVYGSWEGMSRVDMLLQQGVLNPWQTDYDSVLAEFTDHIGDERSMEAACEYFKETYLRPGLLTGFVSSEAVCHRWDNLLALFELRGLIEKDDAAGAVYYVEKAK